MLVIKLKCHGINFNSLVGLMIFFIWGFTFINLTWKELSYQYIVASVSYTGSLGPGSRDTRGRVSPLGQPHLPACQMNGVWGVAPVASGKGLDREIDQCSWVASTYCWSLLLLFSLPKSVSFHTCQPQKKWPTQRKYLDHHQQRLNKSKSPGSRTRGHERKTSFSYDVSTYRKEIETRPSFLYWII